MRKSGRFQQALERFRKRKESLGKAGHSFADFNSGRAKQKYDYYRTQGLSHEAALEKTVWYFNLSDKQLRILKKYAKP